MASQLAGLIQNAKNVTTFERIVIALSSILSGCLSLLLAPFGYAFVLDNQVMSWVMGRMAKRAKSNRPRVAQ